MNQNMDRVVFDMVIVDIRVHGAAKAKDASYHAYYMGRNATYEGSSEKNPFTDPVLRDSWNRGRRHVLSEERLSADTEWDMD